MKLLRYGPVDNERPGLLDRDGRIRDLSGHVPDITAEAIAPASVQMLRSLNTEALPLVHGVPRLAVPVARVGKCIAIGLNYTDHAKEADLPIPAEPVVFSKATSALVGANDPVTLPKDGKKGDWEVELGIIIGQRASYVDEGQALNYVAGYCVVNDVSEREYQLERGGSWDKGKSFDTFGPTGPWLVTSDEVGDPQNLEMWLDVNGQGMQTGSTKNMIFSCAYLVSYVSRLMTLMPGDVVITGTPPGVGMGKKPKPIYLKPGDVMTLGIEKLGEQRQNVLAWRDARKDVQ